MRKIPCISIDYTKDLEQKKVLEAIEKVVKSGHFILGPEVDEFEKQMASFLNIQSTIGVANGTDALVLALDALGIGFGDEVITTAFTFFATAEAIARVGAKPVFVDVDEKTYNINPANIEQAITQKTKAIMVVHIFGNPADMRPIVEIAKRHDLKVIEDACQAIGAEYDGQMIGALGDVSCFSFFPTKNLGGFGDGGLIATPFNEIGEKLKLLRFHGQKIKYLNETLGYNSRLDELQASVLNVKLPFLNVWNERRRQIAERYNIAFSEIDGIGIPEIYEKSTPVYHLYTIRHAERDKLADYLRIKGIETGIYYFKPLHLQPGLSYLGYNKGDLPITELLCESVLSLPMSTDLEEDEVSYIIDTIMSFGG